MKTLHCKITFTEGLLGTAPGSETVYQDFVGSKAPDAQSLEEEVAALGTEEVIANGMTVFPRTEDGKPFLYDYQIKGFFKDACGCLSRVAGKDPETGKKKAAVNESGKMKAYKKIIDGLIFVKPRKIPLVFEGEVGVCERPLRAQTAQGERVALAMSEEIPAGATAAFDVICMSDEHEAAVREWLDYGIWRGLGQWRNSGKGSFACEISEG